MGGALADMFDQRERGTAVVMYSLAVVAGPALGPVIGNAVSEVNYLGLSFARFSFFFLLRWPILTRYHKTTTGWRWTEWLIVILSSVCAFPPYLPSALVKS